MKFESVTLQRTGDLAYQVTVWSDGVIRWDGETGTRSGAWQTIVDSGWLDAMTGLIADLPASTKRKGGPNGTLVVDAANKRSVHALGRDAEPAAVWLLAMVVDGITMHIPWAPLDVTGEHDFAPWTSGHRMTFRQGTAHGLAIANPDGFLLLAGSTANTATAPTLENNYKEVREALIEDGGLHLIGDTLLLTRHMLFTSPSAPACVLVGSNTNGRRAWRDPNGVTWAELSLT